MSHFLQIMFCFGKHANLKKNVKLICNGLMVVIIMQINVLMSIPLISSVAYIDRFTHTKKLLMVAGS